jgi:hypothetical protein
MSLANFDEIFLICCDWDSGSIRPEMIQFEESKFIKVLDLNPLITDYSWESGAAEVLSDQENTEVLVGTLK